MVMFCSLPVPRSLAETWTMPLASISKVTSIWGTPLGAAGMPSRRNMPRVLLSAAISRSPWSTWTSTEVWPSAAVENTWDFLAGILVFLSIILVETPPRVSMPRDRGVTSTSRMLRSSISRLRIAPSMAAPMATHSSGLMPLKGSLPVMFLTASCTAGILVEPPTRRILSRSEGLRPESLSA